MTINKILTTKEYQNNKWRKNFQPESAADKFVFMLAPVFDFVEQQLLEGGQTY